MSNAATHFLDEAVPMLRKLAELGVEMFEQDLTPGAFYLLEKDIKYRNFGFEPIENWPKLIALSRLEFNCDEPILLVMGHLEISGPKIPLKKDRNIEMTAREVNGYEALALVANPFDPEAEFSVSYPIKSGGPGEKSIFLPPVISIAGSIIENKKAVEFLTI